MKKPLPAIAVFACLLLAACGNQSGTAPSPSAAASSSPVSANRDMNDVDLIVGANYYEEVEDEKGNAFYKYLNWLPAGETVLLLSDEVKSVKVLDRNGAKMDEMIGPARLTSGKESGKEAFVSRYYILPKQRAGVIIAAEKANVYNGLKPLNVTGKSLPRRTLVAVAPVEEEDNPLRRQRFVAYNVPQADGSVFKAGVWSPFYVDPAEVSTSKSDVEVAKVIQGMEKIDKAQWGTVVSAAEKQYGDSILLNDARAMIAQAGGLVARSVESVRLTATANSEGVSVLTEPDENVGSVIGTLEFGTKVDITAQTTDSYSVGDVNSRWYKIKSGDLVGWVFGGYLAVSE